MKKIIVCIIVIVVVIALGCFAFNRNLEEDPNTQNTVNNEEQVPGTEETDKPEEPSAISINSSEELIALVDELYLGNEALYPSIATQAIDVADADSVSFMTGLENGNDLEYLVVSEPMVSSQAYSLIIAKVKEGVDANSIAKKMSENINTRKWVCVQAEKLYATSTGDIVFLVMSSDEMAKPVYEAFKLRAGGYGEEFEKTEMVEELPEDMY